MHSNTHLVELVLVTRVVMVLEEAIVALMVEVGGDAMAWMHDVWLWKYVNWKVTLKA